MPKSTSSHPSNNKPPLKSSERRAQLTVKLRQQARLRTYVLLLVIASVWVIDILFINNGVVITRSAALGAFLNWLTQTLFAWIVFRYSSVGSGRNIVNMMYLGQLIKWLLIIVGFSVILLMIEPLSTAAMLLGFILMQLGNFLLLYRLNKLS